MNAENIAKENKEIAAETEVVAAEAVIEALNTETEAVEAYAEAVKEEVQAADAVVEAAEAKNVATEAVIESVEEVTELMDNEAKEDEIKEAETELKENMEKQQEAEKTLVEAITNEDIAAEEVETTSSKEDQASDNLEKAIEADEKASDDLEDAITREEKAEEEVQEVVETSKTIKSVHEETPNDSKPFLKDDKVTHGVYGNGTVLQLNKAGKHWSVEVDFKEGKRRILGTFLTLNEVSESHIEKQEPDEESFKKPESKDVAKIQKVEENSTQITEVVTESVETDYGEYPPGTKISHDIFGKGEVKNSKPKGEAYRLDLFFEDGSERTLLSTFVKLEDETLPEAAVEAEPVEAETVEAEPVEAETVLDTDIIYQRPKKGKEVILDLSKPEVQDAEMIDDED
jgi:tetratricopeptide (TPR) repeat protein